MGDVVTALGIDHGEIDVFAGHLRQIVKRDIARGVGIVEPPVGVFLDDDGVSIAGAFGHAVRSSLCLDVALALAQCAAQHGALADPGQSKRLPSTVSNSYCEREVCRAASGR